MRLRALTRRQALSEAGRAGVGGALALALPPQLLAGSSPARGALSAGQTATLRAAVSRIVPAAGPGDWSAADVGADSYILNLLAGAGMIYAGGPTRPRFSRFQRLSRVKRIGW